MNSQPDDISAQVATLYRSGIGSWTICKRLKIGVGRCIKILRANGIELDPNRKHGILDKTKSLSPKVCDLYKAGFGCGTIAKRLEIGVSTVKNSMRYGGLEVDKHRRRDIARCLIKPQRAAFASEQFNVSRWDDESRAWIDAAEYGRFKARLWNRNYPEKRRKKEQNAKQNRTNYHLSKLIRSRVYRVLKGQLKSAPTLKMLGCSIEQLRKHLESKFERWMTWANYGSAWHIDHVCPCASFDLSKPEQQRRCFHFSNLQPLGATENMRKHNTVPVHQPELTLAI